MTYLLVLAALAFVPLAAILILRVNGAIAFMGLCVGSVLDTYTASDVNAVFSSMSTSRTLANFQWVQIALLIVPFVLTILFTRGSVNGGKKVTNVLPALASGLLFALLLTPLLSANVQHKIHAVSFWHQLSNLQTAVVLGGAAFSLLFLLLTHRTHHEDPKKHGKH